MRSSHLSPPRILVIDDVYGRQVPGGNDDRTALCLQLRLEDATGDSPSAIRIATPLARAVFCRGQSPALAVPGNVVENDLSATLRVVDSGWHQRSAGVPPWAMLLLDLRFRTGSVTSQSERHFGPGMPEGRDQDDTASSFFGLRLLEAIQLRYPQLPVIVMSDAPRQPASLQSTTLGAAAFLAKGDPAAAEKIAEYLQRHALIPDPAGEIIGTSIPLLVALRNARRAAVGAESVLIRGETGTGKELIARYIHRHDVRRRAASLIIVDSGTLSPELYASELFGHKRGSFTGALTDRQGSIVDANRGILFLDEIGNIDDAVQRGLLRVLQEKQVRAVGDTRSREVDVRFLFATNEDIESRAAAENRFRLDLLERMRQGGTIVLPPLRERLDDAPPLVEALVREAEEQTPGAIHRRIDDDVFERIARHRWPGNIRELRACIFKAVRSRPDVEHLVPIHLEITGTAEPRPQRLREWHEVDPVDLEHAIAVLQQLNPRGLSPEELTGRYVALETAFAQAAMRCLRACLDAVRKPTVRNPAGVLLMHPAVKLMLGEETMHASRAYDFIIRLRNLSSAVSQQWDSDSVLGPLFQRARSKRRAGQRPVRTENREMESKHG